MIFYDIEQGSDDWIKLKRGIPTASEFSKIITPAKGDYSASAKPYMLRLLAEKMLGETLHDISGLPAVDRGKALEPQATLAYEIETGISTLRGGFGLSDDRRYGASPDMRLAGVNGGVEMKCPNADTHLGYWFDGFGTAYHCQRQGQMLVFGWDFVDMYSYHPRLPSKIVRAPRDDAFIARLEKHLERFADEMSDLEAQLLATGFFDEIAASDDGWNGYLARLDERAQVMDAG